MKKLITILFAGLLAASAFALDDIIELSGEIKTGVFIEQRQSDGQTQSKNTIYNNDEDSGNTGSRVRFGIALNTKGIGLRTRFSQQNFLYRPKDNINDTSMAPVEVDFAYVQGSLFNGQFRMSAGLLGESPWGTGGPELGRELEYNGSPTTGIRLEWRPLGSLRGLNLGVVLGRSNEQVPDDAKETFGDLFLESILGIAYENPYFGFRFAYRFDRGLESPAAVTEGEMLVYRVEERLLWRLLPGMSISANGYCQGINAGGRDHTPGFIQHWLYISYEPEYFSTGLNFGYYDGFELNAQKMEFRPYFYYNIIPNHLIAGLMGGMEIGFASGKSFQDTFYNFWFIEPQVKVNINNNFYFAVVYRYQAGNYLKETTDKDQVTNWVNLRLGFVF